MCTGFVLVRGCASLLPFGRPRLTGGAGVGVSSSSSDGASCASAAVELRRSALSLLVAAAICAMALRAAAKLLALCAGNGVAVGSASKDSVSEGSIVGHAVYIIDYNSLQLLNIYGQGHGLIARGDEAPEDVSQRKVELRKRRRKANRIDVRVIFLEDHVP